MPTFRDQLARLRHGFHRLTRLAAFNEDRLPGFCDPATLRRLAATADGDFAKAFFAHKGRTIDKWLPCLAAYERHFARFRLANPTLIEIGVSKGGSLELWRTYFGRGARIVGLDIDPACRDLATPPSAIRIGSQADPPFLRRVVDEFGRPDIVIDDGSHVASHQRISFETLFPLLKEGGLYVIEDLHTAYWPGVYQGGYRRPGSAIELVKDIIDDMHGWYHGQGSRRVPKDSVVSVSVHDSIVVIEKGEAPPPTRLIVGA